MSDLNAAPQSTRAALLGVAEAMAAELPWHEVTMAKIAKACGVSRQTVYNEFGTKQGLARAVALVLASRLLDVFTAAADAHDDFERSLAAGLEAAFAHADTIPVVTAVLTGSSGDGLLTVVTTDATAVIELASSAVTDYVLARWPRLDGPAIAPLSDATIRLFVSHLLQPARTRDRTAAEIAAICAAVVAR